MAGMLFLVRGLLSGPLAPFFLCASASLREIIFFVDPQGSELESFHKILSISFALPYNSLD